MTIFNRWICASLFRLLCFLGRPIHGLRPRRVYHFLARRGFDAPEFEWYSDEWGSELSLSPYYILDREIIAFGSYERKLHIYLESCLNHGMVAFDIGANIGSITCHMARLVGEDGRVIAFEPVPTLLTRLKQNIARNDLGRIICVKEVALSAMKGQAEMAFADTRAENQGMGSIYNINNSVVTESFSVELETLDGLEQDLDIKRCDLIKVDIQGAELAFLKGSRRFLHKYSPVILMEVSPSDLLFCGSTSEDLCKAIEELHYQIYLLNGDKISANDVTDAFCQSSIVCVPR